MILTFLFYCCPELIVHSTTLGEFSVLRYFFTNCKKFYNFIFTKTVTAEIFSRTPLPVGIGMFFMRNTRKLTPSLQDWYVHLPIPTVGFRRNYYTYMRSTGVTAKLSKIGQNIVFLRRKESGPELTIAKWKKPVAPLLLTRTNSMAPLGRIII